MVRTRERGAAMGADHDPNAGLAMDPVSDPTPVFHWLQEVGPSILEVIKAMLGFVVGIV